MKITLREYLNHLQKLVDSNPKCANYPVIYSHDDEGNEYQRVINFPSLCQLHEPEQKNYRFLELVGCEEDEHINSADCNTILIN